MVVGDAEFADGAVLTGLVGGVAGGFEATEHGEEAVGEALFGDGDERGFGIAFEEGTVGDLELIFEGDVPGIGVVEARGDLADVVDGGVVG